MATFTITTLGCRVNQCESDAIGQRLIDSDWKPAISDEPADVCIINTCTVTQKASMQSRQAIRKAVRDNPGARVIVTGCYAETEPEKIEPIEGVNHIVGHADKHRISHLIVSHPQKHSKSDRKASNKNFFPVSIPAVFRTRPVLKIQDGCNAFCTYCIVPYARGRSRSMPVSAVMQSLADLHRKSVQEVVLSGIHLGCYGHDLLPKMDLYRLLCKIDREAAIERIRLSSIEPVELTDAIINLVADSNRFCQHFHIPMQSGDRGVLEKMQRPYNPTFFASLVMRIHKRMPNAAIGADVLIGFPGEDEKAFQATAAIIEQLPITYLHVFPFSPREGTPAARFPDAVPTSIVKERCRQIREIGLKKKTAFYRQNIEITHSVLIENRRDRKTGYLRGMANNYIPILIDGPDSYMNRFILATIDKIHGVEILGRVCRQKNVFSL